MNPVVHFEIPVDAVDRAKKFYSELFDWGLKAFEGAPYTMVTTTEIDEKTWRPTKPGEINGGIFKREAGSPVTAPVVVIAVDNIDTKLKDIEAAGGKTISPKEAVSDMGYAAYFQDPEGNIVGLFEVKQQGGNE